MYNRYLNADGFDEYFTPLAQETAPPEPEPSPAAEPPKAKGGLQGLLGNLGDKIKLPDLDSDTILLLVLVYFLITDKDAQDDGKVTDTLLIVGALLLLGF